MNINSIIEARANEHGTIERNNQVYILLEEAHIDGNGSEDLHAADYKAYAVRKGDDVDKDGYLPVYIAVWDILPEWLDADPEESWASDESCACDWDNPASVELSNVVWAPDRDLFF